MAAVHVLRYEGRLAAEREAGLRLKGENGIMKKKFGTLQKEIDDQHAEIAQLFEHKKELYAARAACPSKCKSPTPGTIQERLWM